MGAVREMVILMKVPVMEFDRDEFSRDAAVDQMDTYWRVVEKYREVADPDTPAGGWWQNRDGDTLDLESLFENQHLSRIDVQWVDEFAD